MKHFESRLFSILIFVFFVSFSNKAFSVTDTSQANVDRLVKRGVYCVNQSRKTNVPEHKRETYKQEYEQILIKLDDVKHARMEAALLHPSYKSLLAKIKKDSIEIASEFEMAKLFDPELYPVESGATVAGFQVSFLPIKGFTAPFSFFADRTVTENITLGVQLTTFTQQDEFVKGFPDPEDLSYSSRSKNYTYSNVMLGFKGAYHFFEPGKTLFNRDPLKWDFYLGGMLGYSLALKPQPFLKNRSFERDPSRDGVAYGLFPGVRYMADEHLGFHLEVGYGTTGFVNAAVSYKFVKSEVVKEKPKKAGKGKSSSSSKSSSGKKKKSSSKKRR